MKSAIFVLLLIFGIAGCEGEDSPAEKCDDMLSTICLRFVECIGGKTQETCLQGLQTSVSCGSTIAVTANYDRCMDQIRGFTCSTLFPTDSMTGDRWLALPADCENVFQSSQDTSDVTSALLNENIESVVQ